MSANSEGRAKSGSRHRGHLRIRGQGESHFVRLLDMPLYRINGSTLDCNIPLPMPLLMGTGAPILCYDFESYEVKEADYWDTHGAAPAEAIEREEDAHVTLRYWGGAWARLSGDRISARSPEIFPDEFIHYRVLTMLLPYWQHQRGYVCLHGAAVAIDDRAVGFIADKHSGKTTLAGFFTRCGHRFITDDAITLEVSNSGALMHPSQPELRMVPHQAEFLLGSTRGLKSIIPGREAKLGVAVTRLGSMQMDALPTSVLYMPKRRKSMPGDLSVRIETLSPARALLALQAHPSAGAELLAHRLPETLLQQLPELLRHVAVRRIEYPSGFEHLPRVYDAIRDDLAKP